MGQPLPHFGTTEAPGRERLRLQSGRPSRGGPRDRSAACCVGCWDRPDEGSEVGSDLDLHFVHHTYAVGGGHDGDGDGIDDPWFHQPFDTFWFTPKPNWGTLDPTANDDPSRDRDDTDGAGPENLNLVVPQNGVTYGIGVHYWSDHGFGDAYATVRICARRRKRAVPIGGARVARRQAPRPPFVGCRRWREAEEALWRR